MLGDRPKPDLHALKDEACFLVACGLVAPPALRRAHVARWPSGPALKGEAESRLVGVAEQECDLGEA